MTSDHCLPAGGVAGAATLGVLVVASGAFLHPAMASSGTTAETVRTRVSLREAGVIMVRPVLVDW